MIPKMRLSSCSVGLPLAGVPGWIGGPGAVCWQKAMSPQKQLAPRRAAIRILVGCWPATASSKILRRTEPWVQILVKDFDFAEELNMPQCGTCVCRSLNMICRLSLLEQKLHVDVCDGSEP